MFMEATESKMTQFLRQQALAHGWVAAPKAEAAPLVADGTLERISGKGRGKGNTPCWGLTAAARDEHATTASTETVRCLGGEWPVLERLESGEVIVWRRGTRTKVPAALIR